MYPSNEVKEVDISAFETDSGLRLPITVYPINCCDDVHRACIIMGPCQPKLKKYKPTLIGNRNRRFLAISKS